MKLLLDENISHRILRLIEEDYPGSVHVNFAGPQLRNDHVIWAYAKEHGFVVLTFDTDFVQIAALRGAPPRVLLLELRNPSFKEIANELIHRKQEIERFVATPASDVGAVMMISG